MCIHTQEMILTFQFNNSGLACLCTNGSCNLVHISALLFAQKRAFENEFATLWRAYWWISITEKVLFAIFYFSVLSPFKCYQHFNLLSNRIYYFKCIHLAIITPNIWYIRPNLRNLGHDMSNILKIYGIHVLYCVLDNKNCHSENSVILTISKITHT